MKPKQNPAQVGRVTTEGDSLYYEVRGQGPPLLLIPGGAGDSTWYAFVADLLADEYKVITYDRRANARSTMNPPQNFALSQQSRDAVAVLRAAGEESAFVCGNSSGAVIALDLATTQAQAVRAVVPHEPPLARVHPQARHWQRFFAGVYWQACAVGGAPALLWFALGAGLPLWEFAKVAREAQPALERGSEPRISPAQALDVLLKLELLPVTNYLPDVAAIQRNGVQVFMAAGRVSLRKKRFYAQTAPILAKQLGCAMVVFPGHHISYVDRPQEWAATLRRVLRKAAQA